MNGGPSNASASFRNALRAVVTALRAVVTALRAVVTALRAVVTADGGLSWIAVILVELSPERLQRKHEFGFGH
jgi:hypothetical protein